MGGKGKHKAGRSHRRCEDELRRPKRRSRLKYHFLGKNRQYGDLKARLADRKLTLSTLDFVCEELDWLEKLAQRAGDGRAGAKEKLLGCVESWVYDVRTEVCCAMDMVAEL